jgi:hypothetical protein
LFITVAVRDLFDFILSQGFDEIKMMKNISQCLNNIVNNNVLYIIIVLCLLINQELAADVHPKVNEFLELFLIGRVLFSIGYIFGTIVGH